MEKAMLKLDAFSHNLHPSGVKILAKIIKLGISVINLFVRMIIS
jgi:hypothetical protein